MKVIICGAGIAGLALANRLSALGGEVVLLERTEAPREQGYMIDFFGAGYDAAEEMGLLPAIENAAYHLHDASLVDEHGRRRARVRPQQFADGPLLNIMRPDLERVLREALPAEVDLRFGTGPAAVDDRGNGAVRVTLHDGAQLDADLVVGADGVHSTVRELVFGEEASFFDYLGLHTAAFVLDAPRIHEEVQGRMCLTDTVGRQMGFYALRDGRVASFAVHCTSDPSLPKDARSALRDIYAGMGWLVPEALDRCPPSSEIYYDHVAQIRMSGWSKGRVVLLGDACYAVSLLAGQGASLAVAGAYLLADHLVRSRSIEEALSGYEQLWRPVAEEKQRVARSGVHWFPPDSTSRLWIRRAALSLARLPVLDRSLATIMAGKSVNLIKNGQRSDYSPRLNDTKAGGESR